MQRRMMVGERLWLKTESLKVKAGKALGQGKAYQGNERFLFDFEQLTPAELTGFRLFLLRFANFQSVITCIGNEHC